MSLDDTYSPGFRGRAKASVVLFLVFPSCFFRALLQDETVNY